MSPYAEAVANLNREFVSELVRNGRPANFSPFSLLFSLLLLLLTIKGPARDQLADIVGLSEDLLHPDAVREFIGAIAGDGALEVAANVFSRSAAPAPDYGALMKATFDAEVEPLVSAAQVNRWCDAKTHGMIPEILAELNRAMHTVLISALYFKADWARAFPAGATADADFFTFDRGETRVPLMRLAEDILYTTTDASELAVLLYDASDVAALVALPRAHGREGLLRSVAELDAELFRAASHALPRRVKLFLPRFRAETSLKLGGDLRRLGATGIFEGCDALDTLGCELSVSEVLQKCVVEVDEAGTKAAAVTAVIMKMGISAPPPVLEMRCDRPFVFSLFHRTTGAVLFTTVVDGQ